MIDLKEVEAEEKLECNSKSRQFLWKGEIKKYVHYSFLHMLLFFISSLVGKLKVIKGRLLKVIFADERSQGDSDPADNVRNVDTNSDESNKRNERREAEKGGSEGEKDEGKEGKRNDCDKIDIIYDGADIKNQNIECTDRRDDSRQDYGSDEKINENRN